MGTTTDRRQHPWRHLCFDMLDVQVHGGFATRPHTNLQDGRKSVPHNYVARTNASRLASQNKNTTIGAAGWRGCGPVVPCRFERETTCGRTEPARAQRPSKNRRSALLPLILFEL